MAPRDNPETKWPPAPGDLRILEAWVNSANPTTGVEGWSSPWALGEWMGRQGLVHNASPGPAELERAVEVREALRSLLMANNGGPRKAAAVELLDGAAVPGRLMVRFGQDGPRLESVSQSFDDVLARLFAAVVLARAEGIWERFKACAACRRAFFDHSRTRRGKWCSDRCGIRVRSRAFRRRR